MILILNLTILILNFTILISTLKLLISNLKDYNNNNNKLIYTLWIDLAINADFPLPDSPCKTIGLFSLASIMDLFNSEIMSSLPRKS